MTLEYAHEAVQQGDYEAAKAWALVSMADDLYSILELLREMRPALSAALPRVYTEVSPLYGKAPRNEDQS